MLDLLDISVPSRSADREAANASACRWWWPVLILVHRPDYNNINIAPQSPIMVLIQAIVLLLCFGVWTFGPGGLKLGDFRI